MVAKHPFEKEKALKIDYKGKMLEKTCVADFVHFDKVIVEPKAVKELTMERGSEVLNYLKATGYELDLLVNFGGKSFEHEPLVF